MFTRNKLEDMIYFISGQNGKFIESIHFFIGNLRWSYLWNKLTLRVRYALGNGNWYAEPIRLSD